MNYPPYTSQWTAGQPYGYGAYSPYKAYPATQQSYPQPQPIPKILNGMMVPSMESIAANDVPMDGTISVFPKQDLSEIYIKKWEPNGTIKTIIYKPLKEETLSARSTDDISIADTLASLENRINELSSKLEALIDKKKTSKRLDETV